MIPEADGGRFIILLPSDTDDDVTYIPCDFLTAPSFLRMAERLGAEWDGLLLSFEKAV